MQVESKLAIIIDPPNQDPELASARVDEFIQKGGKGVLVGGSGAGQPVNLKTVIQTRHLIDKLYNKTSLFVSGGIRNPVHVRLFAGTADYIVVGGHFERNGTREVPEFVEALKNPPIFKSIID